MRIPYFQVNAFTSETFGGNPAGVCLLESWLPDPVLQRIAAENDLSETAFLVGAEVPYHVRWMTPTAEVDLCGHATLAAAHVLFFEKRQRVDRLVFQSRSGELAATRRGDLIELDFPSRPPESCSAPAILGEALRCQPLEVFKARDYLAVFSSAADVAAIQPDMASLCQLDSLGVIITAPGENEDFVCRFFAPKVGVPEDPVTGSAHCSLVPYWSKRLGKTQLLARQISKRRGVLHCRLLGERVGLAGQAVTYCRGELQIQ